MVTEGGPDAHLHEYPGIRLEPWFQFQEIELYLRICAYGEPSTVMEWQLNTDYSVLAGGGVYGESGPLRPTQRFWNLRQLGSTPAGARALPLACSAPWIPAAVFGGLADRRITLHLANRGGSRPAVVEGLPAGVGGLQGWVTAATRGMERLERIPVVDGRAAFTLPAAAYVTLAGPE